MNPNTLYGFINYYSCRHWNKGPSVIRTDLGYTYAQRLSTAFQLPTGGHHTDLALSWLPSRLRRSDETEINTCGRN